jgi:hypothetical protein
MNNLHTLSLPSFKTNMAIFLAALMILVSGFYATGTTMAADDNGSLKCFETDQGVFVCDVGTCTLVIWTSGASDVYCW